MEWRATALQRRPTLIYFPVPLKVMVCVAAAELSDSVTVAVRVPVADGVNVTEIVQVACAANVLPTGHVVVFA